MLILEHSLNFSFKIKGEGSTFNNKIGKQILERHI